MFSLLSGGKTFPKQVAPVYTSTSIIGELQLLASLPTLSIARLLNLALFDEDISHSFNLHFPILNEGKYLSMFIVICISFVVKFLLKSFPPI